jgi:hypothetical protein
MQQGRGGMGSHKHGISGHASQSPRLRLMKKLAAERASSTAVQPCGRNGSNSKVCEMP